jgi:nucleoside-diphosphate-sugar epimerase
MKIPIHLNYLRPDYEKEVFIMSKRYLVTGGAGFLGINLVRFLLNKGHNVTSLDFAEFDYRDVIKKVNVIKGDIRDKGIVLKSMEDVDIVVHTAAALPLYKEKDIYSTEIDGTRNVLDAAFTNNVERVIHISSTAVYGIPDHHPLYEDDKLDGVGPYGKAKIKAEEVCLEYIGKGMCIPIVRPKSFIGPERLGVFALFYDWAKNGKGFPMIGNGKNRYQLLDVEDLCEAIYLTATGDKEKVNDIFNIGAKEFTTMKEDYQVVLHHAGFGKRITCFPAEPMIWTLRILEFLRLSPLYKWVYETASKDSFVSIEKAEKILGFKPKYSNKDALIRNFKWYIDNMKTFDETSGISHRVPWNQGILKLASNFF